MCVVALSASSSPASADRKYCNLFPLSNAAAATIPDMGHGRFAGYTPPFVRNRKVTNGGEDAESSTLPTNDGVCILIVPYFGVILFFLAIFGANLT